MALELLKHVLDEVDKVEHFAEANGKKVYTFEDAQTLNKAELIDIKMNGNKRVELGQRRVTGNGLSYASSNVKRAAINPETFFDNRYRKVTEGKKVKYEVVTDYRAIKEQSSGQVYTDNVIVYVVSKDEKGIVVETTKTISANDFVRDFKSKLDIENAKQIVAAISKLGNTGMTADTLEF